VEFDIRGYSMTISRFRVTRSQQLLLVLFLLGGMLLALAASILTFLFSVLFLRIQNLNLLSLRAYQYGGVESGCLAPAVSKIETLGTHSRCF